MVLKDPDGKVIAGRRKEADIGTNYFKEVLNAIAPYRPLEIEKAANQPPMDTELLTSYEVKRIISAAHGKAYRMMNYHPSF